MKIVQLCQCFVSLSRLQAVPFWIVERSREIGKRDKTGANERREGLGRGVKKGKVSSHLFVLAPVSLRCERIISTDQKGTACSLEFIWIQKMEKI